jgi:tetratricopeptide (TPR) repeat protein
MIEWFNALIDWVLAGWRQLPSKDALSVIVSTCSLLIALASLGYTIRSKRRDATTAARNNLHSCVSEISKIMTEREEKERELGDKFYSAEHTPMRASLNDRAKLYLSKAVLLSRTYRKVDLSSFESLLLGAALADEGKYYASLRFYKRAVKISADPADKAAALSVYGRALIASGHPRWGRWRMRKAAKLFAALSRKRGYDDDKMNYESADTYARLVRTQLRWNYRKKTRADLTDFRRSIARIKDPHARQSMEEALAEITGSPRTPAEPPPGPSPAPAPASGLSPAVATVTSEPSPKVTAPISPADEDTRQGSLPLSPAEIRAH